MFRLQQVFCLGFRYRPPSRASSLPQEPCPCRRQGMLFVGAALAAMRPQPSAGFDPGCCRGRKTPPTEPSLVSPTGHAFVGAALAAMRPLQVRRLRYRLLSGSEDPSHRTLARAADRACFCGSDLGRDAAAALRRLRSRLLSGSEDPSHRTLARAADRACFLWERPWPRCGRGSPPASIQAAVGVGRPLPHNPRSCRRQGMLFVGAALAAMRPLQSAGFDPGCRRGRKTPPTEPSLAAELPTRARGCACAAAVRPSRRRCRGGRSRRGGMRVVRPRRRRAGLPRRRRLH